jgi:hypothetical protein
MIDEIAKKYGHTILCLPPYHYIFTPIELTRKQFLRKGIDEIAPQH